MNDIEELLLSGRPVLLTNRQLREIIKGRPRQTLMNMTEVGEYLGSTRWYVQLLIRQGAFPFIPTGKKHKRIDIRDVDKWIEKTKRLASDQGRRGP